MNGIILKKENKKYFVYSNNDKREYECYLKGSFKFHKNFIPIVGDRVNLIKENNLYFISSIFERKNILIRPKIANINIMVIVQSIIEPNINTDLIYKYLLLFEYQKLNKIIIIFTKTDLIKNYDIKKEHKYLLIDNYDIYDANNEEDFNKLKKIFKNKVVCFSGQSGVGKSTLLNKLVPELNIKTNKISKKLNRGKHTTTTTKLYRTNYGYIVDTPGFSAFDINLNKKDMAIGYKIFSENVNECQFNNCFHITEKKCKIKELLHQNKISIEKYNWYIKNIEKCK